MIGRSWWDFKETLRQNIENIEEYERQLKEIIRPHKTSLGQEIRLKDGRILLRDYIPIVEKGEYHGQVAIYRDVTNERRIDAAKSEFMSLASHQLRTPLTSVRWTFGRLSRNLRDTLDPQNQRLIDEGKHAATRMAETIDTMLQISQIESGNVQLRHTPIGASEFLKTIALTYEEDALARRQNVTVDVPADLQLVSDERLLKEAVSNLVSNAVKYTPRDGSISLSARREGAVIRIVVSDSGYGIPMHQQQRVFQKFFRGDNVVGRETEGTGLGLHLVFLVVQLLGGMISFESEEQAGTTFTITLPPPALANA